MYLLLTYLERPSHMIYHHKNYHDEHCNNIISLIRVDLTEIATKSIWHILIIIIRDSAGLCLTVFFVSHDDCPDIAKRDRWHTTNIMQVYRWGCVVTHSWRHVTSRWDLDISPSIFIFTRGRAKGRGTVWVFSGTIWACLCRSCQISTWASYQICKIAGCVCTGNVGNVFPATDFKGNRQLAIPACITGRASRTCRDACRDR